MFQPVVDKLKPQWKTIEHYIAFDGDDFQALIDAEDGDYRWVEGDERDPCMLCYTSGTTGNPKGVLYSHRSSMLHALSVIQPDVFELSGRAVSLPIVPMFHAVGWGMPFCAPMVGMKLVFSTVYDGKVLCDLMNREKVTHTAGVPTVWLAMFQHMDATGDQPRHLKLVTIGGSAAPRSMIERITKMGVRVNHAWGMTETSPLGTAAAPSWDWDDLSFEEQMDRSVYQGRAPFGVELRVVDDEGAVQPRDGKTSGRLQVRGPWVIKQYFKDESGPCLTDDGWFDTGDVAVLHADGTMQITDRSKDVIKSGGEWISSVELENAAVGCSGVAEAAAIGIAHPRWDERPLLIVVRKPGSEVSADEIRAHLTTQVAKWWLPDDIVFAESLPHTATGKLLKTALREQYREFRFASA
jgi:fatty-acyl-CoA synthase